MPTDKKSLSTPDVLKRMEHYCAYQDRCHKDVESKMYEFALTQEERDEIICALITDNFLNEERFARSFTRGKHRIKMWGRNRIKNELIRRDIPLRLIQTALTEIDEDQYKAAFLQLADAKRSEIGRINTQAKKAKFYNYLTSKGYEGEMIFEYIGRWQ